MVALWFVKGTQMTDWTLVRELYVLRDDDKSVVNRLPAQLSAVHASYRAPHSRFK